MSEEAILQQIDNACVAFFQTNDQNAHSFLLGIELDLNLFSRLIQRFQTPFTVLFAASRLKQLLTMNATRLISPADAAQFNQLLYHIFPQAVATRNQAVVSALTVLISRFLLVFWLESPEIRDFVKPAVSIYELSPLHACAALELCSSVVQDLQPPYGNFDRFWRKKCLSLRDSGLQSVMQLALHALAGSVQPEHLPFPDADPAVRARLRETAIDLLVHVLTYDFSGNAIDVPEESRSSTINIPMTWFVLKDASTTALLYRCFEAGPATTVAPKALKCLTQMVSFKPSFFHDPNDKVTFMNDILQGICHILETRMHLGFLGGGSGSGAGGSASSNSGSDDGDDSVLHALGDLLSTFSVQHRVSDVITRLPAFMPLVPLVRALTSRVLFAFEMEQYENCVHNLLLFWSDVAKGLSTLPVSLFANSSSSSSSAQTRSPVLRGLANTTFFHSSSSSSSSSMSDSMSSSSSASLGSAFGSPFKMGGSSSAAAAIASSEPQSPEEVAGRAIIDQLFEVSRLFIESKLSLAALLSTDDQAKLLEDPLAEHSPQAQLSYIGGFMRLHVESLSPVVEAHWNQAAQNWQTLKGQPLTSDFVEGWRQAEGRLAWLTYCVTVLLEGLAAPGSGRPLMPASRLEQQSIVFGQLTFKIFEAMDWLREARASGMSTGAPHAWREFELTHRLGERFEMASLQLCQMLHQVCTAESAESPPTVTFLTTLTGALRLDPGGQALLEGLVRKVIGTLTEWKHAPAVVERTLSLFEALSTGLKIVYAPYAMPKVYSNGKMLLQSDYVQALLNVPNPHKFPFLSQSPFIRDGSLPHARRQFWQMMARLFFIQEDNVVEANIEGFLSPVTLQAETLLKYAPKLLVQASGQPSDWQAGEQDECFNALDAVVRDLRGVLQAARRAQSYRAVHRYMMRHCTTVLQLLASQQPLVLRVLPARLCNAALRLVAEAADNACKRIEFSARSVAPILIVRDLGNIVFAFVTLLRQEANLGGSNPYETKYSGVRSCIETVSNILMGDYVNLGVLHLYQDPAYRIFPEVLQIALSLPHSEVSSYPKLHNSLLPFLQTLSENAPWLLLTDVPASLWPNLFDIFREGLSSGQRPAHFVLVLAACNLLLSTLVCLRHGPELARGLPGIKLDELVDSLQRQAAIQGDGTLQALAQQFVATATEQAFPSFLRLVIARAASLPYADKCSTSNFIYSFTLLNSQPAAHPCDPTSTSTIGLNIMLQILTELESALPVHPELSPTEQAEEREKFRMNLENTIEPLQMLTDPMKPMPAGIVRESLREAFESRLTEFFLQFVE